jgi:hypothetical protein
MHRLIASTFSHLSQRNLLIFFAHCSSSGLREEQVFGEVQPDSFEPLRDTIHTGGFVDYLGVGAFMNELKIFPAKVPELRTVSDRILIHVMKGLINYELLCSPAGGI